MKKIEIEKKYLVKFQTWEDLFQLLDSLTAIKRLEQVYLKAIKGDPAARIRKTVEGFKGRKTYYDINQKKPVGTAANKEKEEKISEEDFNKFLKHKDPSKKIIKKDRLVFDYKDQCFELDVFKEHLRGLLILEIELKNKNQKVHLPPYLKIIREITEEEEFNNFNLSDLKVKGFKNGKLIKS